VQDWREQKSLMQLWPEGQSRLESQESCGAMDTEEETNAADDVWVSKPSQRIQGKADVVTHERFCCAQNVAPPRPHSLPRQIPSKEMGVVAEEEVVGILHWPLVHWRPEGHCVLDVQGEHVPLMQRFPGHWLFAVHGAHWPLMQSAPFGQSKDDWQPGGGVQFPFRHCSPEGHWLEEVQSLLVQFPLMQLWPEGHCWLEVQSLFVQFPFKHCWPDGHWLLEVQDWIEKREEEELELIQIPFWQLWPDGHGLKKEHVVTEEELRDEFEDTEEAREEDALEPVQDPFVHCWPKGHWAVEVQTELVDDRLLLCDIAEELDDVEERLLLVDELVQRPFWHPMPPGHWPLALHSHGSVGGHQLPTQLPSMQRWKPPGQSTSSLHPEDELRDDERDEDVEEPPDFDEEWEEPPELWEEVAGGGSGHMNRSDSINPGSGPMTSSHSAVMDSRTYLMQIGTPFGLW
jgi:hypothetical protein